MLVEMLVGVTLAVAGLMFLLWLVSLRLRDVSVIDVAWGPAFVLGMAAALIYRGPLPQTVGGLARSAASLAIEAQILLVLVVVWAARLAIHIALRRRGQKEDARYGRMRAAGGPRWPLRALLTVFGLQGALILVVGAPLWVTVWQPGAQGPAGWIVAGVAVWALGFIFEAGADGQLVRFRADPKNRGRLLTTGFWRYTRHPNYFGDAAQWWGFWLISCATPYGPWMVFAPLLMTFLLVRVSGARMMDDILKRSKPEFAAYAERTNAFLPWWPRNPKR